MVSIISHYLGYWTKRTDIVLQGMFCNQLQILPHGFPLAKPSPVPWVIPFLGWAQILQERCHGMLTEQKGTATSSCSGGSVRSEKTCPGTSKGETCWGSETDLCNFTHMKWRISLHQKNKEAARQKYHTFLHFDYRGLYTVQLLGLV